LTHFLHLSSTLHLELISISLWILFLNHLLTSLLTTILTSQ
jgi:hypothetical protein